MFTVGERVHDEARGRVYVVTALDVEVLPRIKDYLIDAARRREKVTYGALKAGVGLPHAVNGLGRLLDLLSIECQERHQPSQPSLASLVVSGATGEVGPQFIGDPVAGREEVFDFWR